MKFKHCQDCVLEAGWSDLAGTVAQALFRSFLGWISGSMGLVVQGIYSLGDALAKGVALVSIQIAKRPPNKTFPFGYGKILFVSSLIMGAGLLLGGASLGLTSFKEMEGIQSAPSLVTVFGVMLSALASELMHRFLGCVAQENNNTAIKSAAWDNRIDALSSVLVLLGILLSNLGIPAADHISAFLVSIMVVRIGGMIVWDAIKGLLDVSVPHDALADIAKTARMAPGVENVKLTRGRNLGEYWEIYLHIAIDEKLTILEGHEIVASLKKRIQTGFPQVQHVWVITLPQKSQQEDGDDYWTGHLFSASRDNLASKTSSIDDSSIGEQQHAVNSSTGDHE